MKEILYKYTNLGAYFTEDDTSFDNESQIKITVEPHDFSLTVGNEVLRNTSFTGCVIVAYNNGSVAFYDDQNTLIASADKSDEIYKNVTLAWQDDCLSVKFGHIAVIDHYPNCDGESDRYDNKWVTEREVSLNLTNNSVKVELPNL